MYTLEWRPRRLLAEARRCFHHETAGRTAKRAPTIVRKIWRDVTVPVLDIDVAIRECCVNDDPVARVAWWDAVLSVLPSQLAAHPAVGERWLLEELADGVPWPTDEDAVVGHLLEVKKVPGRTAYRRETEYPKLVEAARKDARWLLAQRGKQGGRGPGALGVAAADAYLRQTFGAKALTALESSAFAAARQRATGTSR